MTSGNIIELKKIIDLVIMCSDFAISIIVIGIGSIEMKELDIFN